MQPEQPQIPQPQAPNPYSIDYLNKIATPAPQKTASPWLIWVLIGGVLVAITALVLFIFSLSGKSTESLKSFDERIIVLQDTSKSASKIIQNSQLRSTNSNLAIILTNSKRDLQESLDAKKIKVEEKKLSSEVTKESEKLASTLEDARLNAVYDRTYAREMAYYIKKLRLQMEGLYNGTNDKTLRSTLEDIDSSIAPIGESFSKYNAS
ncbi:MAG TPA: hypothetical protein PL051_00020 [Candidatus Saccharibacteria bacterium]|nr:hypothetical protein [Candidatus Saccharibacteria bacterium]